RDHLHPVDRPELEYLRRGAEHDRAQLALVVLQREVDMARRLRAEVRYLARDPQAAETALEALAHEGRELGDGEDAGRRTGTEQFPRRRQRGQPSRRATNVLKTCQLFNSS